MASRSNADNRNRGPSQSTPLLLSGTPASAYRKRPKPHPSVAGPLPLATALACSQSNRGKINHYNPTPSAFPSFSNRSKGLLFANMLSSVSPWRSLQLGLPTPLQALSQLFPFVDIEELRIPHPYNHVGSRETESLTSLLNLTLPWTPSSSGTDTCPLSIPLVREEPLATWNFHTDVNQSFKLHSAKAFLGLAWLLAF